MTCGPAFTGLLVNKTPLKKFDATEAATIVDQVIRTMYGTLVLYKSNGRCCDYHGDYYKSDRSTKSAEIWSDERSKKESQRNQSHKKNHISRPIVKHYLEQKTTLIRKRISVRIEIELGNPVVKLCQLR